MPTTQNQPLPENFSQVCVIHGLDLPTQEICKDADPVVFFTNYFRDNFDVRVQYLETLTTFPDRDDDGNCVEGTGGRSDLFFAIHDDDVLKFTIPRFQIGARWVEDVLAPCNENRHLYPSRVLDYIGW